MRTLLLLLAMTSLAACAPRADAPRETLVFAAASMTDVAGTLADSFAVAHPDVRVTVSVGASSLLERQIEAGAPADVLFSASPEWTDSLAAAGLSDGPVRDLAGNALVVLGPLDARPMTRPDDLLRVERLALADPAAVPAGRYARAALDSAGLWDRLAPRVVPMQDVRAAAAAVEHGAAEAAIVYASDARVATRARVLLAWPEALAPPVRLTAAVVARRGRSDASTQDARAFVAFAAHPAQAETWRAYGFRPAARPATP